MKPLIFLFAALPALAFAQKNLPIGDFYVEDFTLIYHHVFIDSVHDSAPILAKKVMAGIALLPNIKNLVQSGNVITGTFDWVNAATFSGSELRADFTIEVRNGRYRVTIFDFSQTDAGGKLIPWDYTYMRDDKTEWRPGASQDMPQYDTRFTNMFAIPITQPEANW